MFFDNAVAAVRKWLTTSKTVSTEGKWFADAVAVKELKDEIDGKAKIVNIQGSTITTTTSARSVYTNGHDLRVTWEYETGNEWLCFYVDTILVLKIRGFRAFG